LTKLTLKNPGAKFRDTSQIRSNNDAIVDAIENTLSRDGTGPNQMGANLDMNGFRLLNVPFPGDDLDVVRRVDLASLSIPGPQGNPGPQGPPGPSGLGPTPQSFGAVGDGVADDTAAVRAWAEAGGGVVIRGSRYLIDPIVVTNETRVWAYGATFIQRSPFAANSSSEGLITLTGGGTWIGGRYDGQRDNPAVNSYVAAMRGTGSGDQVRGYKAAVYITASGQDRTYDVGDFEIVDFPGHGLHVVGAVANRPMGRFRTNTYRNCGYACRFDRVKNALIEWQQAEDITNYLADDLAQWMPTVCHVAQWLRCNDCTIQGGSIRRASMRPTTWGAQSFVNGFTQSAMIDCTLGVYEVDGLRVPDVAAADTSGETIASRASVLNHSFVANRRSPISEVYAFRSTATQAIEIVPQGKQSIGRVVLEGIYGRQSTASGGDGINIHGRPQGYQERISTYEQKLQGSVDIGWLDVSGYHRGVYIRKNEVSIRAGRIYGNRIDGISLGARSLPEWGAGAGATQNQKPSLYLGNVDIYNNGHRAVRLVRGNDFIWRAGRCYGNAQRVGFDDPTVGGTYWPNRLAVAGSEAVIYDSAAPDADPNWRSVEIADIDTRSRPTATLTAEAGFMNGTPGANSWVPDSRLKFMLVSVKNPSDYQRGQRLRLEGVNTAQDENINVWIADFFGDLVLAEVDQTSGAYAGAWDADENAAASSVGGTWNYDGSGTLLRATGTNGTAISDIDGPCFVRAVGESGFAFVVTVGVEGGVDALYVLNNSDFGPTTTWAAPFSGKELEIIQVDVLRQQAQPTANTNALTLAGMAGGITNQRNIRGFGGTGAARWDTIELNRSLEIRSNTAETGQIYIRQANVGGAASMRYQQVDGTANINWSTGMRAGAAPAASGVFCIQAGTSLSAAAPFALTTSGTLGLGFTSSSAPNRHQDINTAYVLDNNGNVNVRGTVHVNGTQVVGARVVNAALANSANTGDAPTNALIDALRDLVNTHGLGAAS